jgi:hypothetical protein
MKKKLILLLSCIFLGLTLNLQAANVTFSPRVVELKVAPGETGRAAIKVHGFSTTVYTLNFLVGSKLETGNIPRGWLTAAYLWLDSNTEGSSSANMDLVVSVPPEAKPGTYTGLFVPDDMRSSEPIKSPGVIISIEVSQ